MLRWHQRHGRPDFLWRRRPTPYRVLVAEVMLQQTQVSRVEPKYREFLRRYRTLQALAEASTAELLRLWSGLGYNRRALLLRECARQVMARHSGRLPTEVAALEALPAIGPYTARAIAIFAHNADDVCIDTNVRRVLIHELGLPNHLHHRQLAAVARQILPLGKSRRWHNALMDYGRLVATSRATRLRPTGVWAGRFIGSRRYYRGWLLKTVVAAGRISWTALAQELNLTVSAVKKIAADMRRDGLVSLREHGVALPR